jgi:GMP synthase - Glutamine amidotransferase domain
MQKIIILDCGSQVTQLIGRRLRELNVYCEIIPFSKTVEITPEVRGIVLSGSPCSVLDANAPRINWDNFLGKVPVLGYLLRSAVHSPPAGRQGGTFQHP